LTIGIITFHFSHNNGALLQCFALVKYLESCGHTVYVIDYRPAYHNQLFVENPNPFVLAKRAFKEYKNKGVIYQTYRMIRRFIGVIIRYNDAESKKRRIRMQNWETFAKNNFNLTKRYNSIGALRKDPPSCDIYISGSDQLWNPNLTGYKLDKSYFLDFGSDNVKRITYAISPCMLDIDRNQEQLSRLGKKLDAISLRESEKLDSLSKVFSKEIFICPDPTLLIGVDCYEAIVNKSTVNEYNYILVYLMEDEVRWNINRNMIIDMAKRLNLRIIDISMHERAWDGNVTCHNGVSIEDFLSYIKHADFIITNSFHCTVFSILYRKRFITLPIGEKTSRTKNLLEKLDLSERFVCDCNDDIFKNLAEINYESVDQHLLVLQESGYLYLHKYLCMDD